MSSEVDIRTRQQLWKDMTGNLVEKEAELANTYDMPLSAPTKKPGTTEAAEDKLPGKPMEKGAGSPMNPLDAAMKFRGAIGEAGAFHGGDENLSDTMQAHLRDLVARRASSQAAGEQSMADYAQGHPTMSRAGKAVSGALMGAGAGTGVGALAGGNPLAMGLGAAGGAALGGLGGYLADTTPGEYGAKAQQTQQAAQSLDPEVLDRYIEQAGRMRAGKGPKGAPVPIPTRVGAPPMAGPQGLDIRIAVPLMAAMQQQQANMEPKTASVAVAVDEEDELLKQAFRAGPAVPPDDTLKSPVKGEMVKELPQAKVLKPKVDVSSKDPPRPTEKHAEFYAVPSQARYPLDGYDQVKTASSYFDEWSRHMPLEMRREYCQNLVKRANVLRIPVSEEAARYASDKYASQSHIDICLDARRVIIQEPVHLALLDKLAASRQHLLPEDYIECLAQFDKLACIDEHYGVDVPDPYLSTLEAEKVAVKTESDPKPDESINIGTENITKRELFEFSKRGHSVVCSRFGKDFAKDFAADPMGIFNSLPRDQKLVMMRMVSSGHSPATNASTS